MSRIDDALRRVNGGNQGPGPGIVPVSPEPLPAPVAAAPALPAPRSTAYTEDQALEVRRLLLGLWRRKWEIALVACVVLVPIMISTALATRLYRASAMVQIDPEPTQVLPYREIDLPSLTPNYELFMKSQEQILRGPTLVARIATRLQSGPEQRELAPEVPHLWTRLSIQRIENTQMFRLAYVAPNPYTATKVANVFAEEYIKLHFEDRDQTREKARQLLQRELETLEQRVQASEKGLVSYAQANGISTLDATQTLVGQRLSELSKQLTESDGQEFVAQAKLDSLQQASVDAFPANLETDVIRGLVTQVSTLEHDKTALRTTFGEKWPAVVQKDRELALVKEQLQRAKIAVLEAARQQAQIERAAADSKRKMLGTAVDEQQQLANKLESASIQYNIIRREVETNRKMYDGLLERLKQTSLTAGMEFGGFRVVEPATPSFAVDSPRVKWNLLIGTLLGLALGVCVALIHNYWDTSITTIEEVEQIDMLPVLGTLPLMSSGPMLRLPARVLRMLPGRVRESDVAPTEDQAGEQKRAPRAERRYAQSAVSEDVRNICASILLSRSGSAPHVLLVTSATPGEGKTTVASTLARALAENGAGTLLVDCDLRRGRIGQMFDVDGEGGLSLFLAGHLASVPTIHKTNTPNLFVISAGPSAPNPPALLGTDRMKQFLSDMTASFRFVILDTPPVIPVADTRVLARMAEGVVVVVGAGKVARPIVHRVCSIIQSAGGTLLGAVVNRADGRLRRASYYHYYSDHATN